MNENDQMIQLVLVFFYAEDVDPEQFRASLTE